MRADNARYSADPGVAAYEAGGGGMQIARSGRRAGGCLAHPDRIGWGMPRVGYRLPVARRCGCGRQSYLLLMAAIVVLSTVANPVQATSGTASSAAGGSIRRASRA